MAIDDVMQTAEDRSRPDLVSYGRLKGGKKQGRSRRPFITMVKAA